MAEWTTPSAEGSVHLVHLMLLQTNSYIVPRDKRDAHARLLRKFRQVLLRLGCEHFEAYEQVGTNWSPGEGTGRFVQIMRFRDRHHQQQVQAAERADPAAQQLIREFCELINFPYQQQQGLFATGYYQSTIPIASPRRPKASPTPPPVPPAPTVPPPTPVRPEVPTAARAAHHDEPPVEVQVQPVAGQVDADAADGQDDGEDCLTGLLSAGGADHAFDVEDADVADADEERVDFEFDQSSEDAADDDRHPTPR